MKIDRNAVAVPQRKGVSDVSDVRDARGNIASVKSTPSGSHAIVRADTLELSVQGRALASREEVSAERMAQIRDRIDAGFYNDSHVAEAVARRLHADRAV